MRVMHSFPSKANLDQSKNQFIIQVENDGSKKGTWESQGWPSKAAMLACMSATATGHIVFMSTWFSLSYKKWDSSHHALEDFFWKLMFATWKGKQVIISLSTFLQYVYTLMCMYWQNHIAQHQCIMGKSASQSGIYKVFLMCKVILWPFGS